MHGRCTMIVTDRKVLRQISKPWRWGDKNEIDSLVEKMWKALEEKNGAGLSAIQIGYPLRVFIVGLEVNEVFVNPAIVNKSSIMKKDWEGCLSCGHSQVRVPRSHSITLKYWNQDLEHCERKFTGFEARVVQHELDHLNGFLIIDRGKEYKP